MPHDGSRPPALLRLAGLFAGTLLLVILLGCMSISIGGKHMICPPEEEGGCMQQGETRMPPHGEMDVYYPVPFASPPNLELDDVRDVVVLDQKADHFRVRYDGPFPSNSIKWKARGTRAVGGAAPPQPMPWPPPAPQPAPLPPPVPIKEGTHAPDGPG